MSTPEDNVKVAIAEWWKSKGSVVILHESQLDD